MPAIARRDGQVLQFVVKFCPEQRKTPNYIAILNIVSMNQRRESENEYIFEDRCHLEKRTKR